MSEFRVASVIERTFSVILQNLVPFVILSLIVYIPLVVLALMQPGEADPQVVGVVAAVDSVLQLFLPLLMMAAVTYGTVQSLRGMRAGVGDCLSYGLSRILPVLGVAVLMWLALAVGMLLLVLPFFFVLTLLFVAIPVSVVERPGVLGSLQRSAALTKGYRLKIFGLVLVMTLLLFVIMVPTAFGMALLTAGVGSASVGVALGVLVSAVISLIPAVMAAVVYHDLRLAKEGIDTEQLAAVFA